MTFEGQMSGGITVSGDRRGNGASTLYSNSNVLGICTRMVLEKEMEATDLGD